MGGAKYGRILPGELTALGTNHGGVGKLLIYNGTISTPFAQKGTVPAEGNRVQKTHVEVMQAVPSTSCSHGIGESQE